MSKTELTNDERSQRIRSVEFNNKTSLEPEAVDACRFYGCACSTHAQPLCVCSVYKCAWKNVFIW